MISLLSSGGVHSEREDLDGEEVFKYMMKNKMKEVSRLEAICILKDIQRKIQSMEETASPDVIDECWKEVCKQLDRIETPGSNEEFRSLNILMKMIAELHGTESSGCDTQNQPPPDE